MILLFIQSIIFSIAAVVLCNTSVMVISLCTSIYLGGALKRRGANIYKLHIVLRLDHIGVTYFPNLSTYQHLKIGGYQKTDFSQN